MYGSNIKKFKKLVYHVSSFESVYKGKNKEKGNYVIIKEIEKKKLENIIKYKKKKELLSDIHGHIPDHGSSCFWLDLFQRPDADLGSGRSTAAL